MPLPCFTGIASHSTLAVSLTEHQSLLSISLARNQPWTVSASVVDIVPSGVRHGKVKWNFNSNSITSLAALSKRSRPGTSARRSLFLPSARSRTKRMPAPMLAFHSTSRSRHPAGMPGDWPLRKRSPSIRSVRRACRSARCCRRATQSDCSRCQSLSSSGALRRSTLPARRAVAGCTRTPPGPPAKPSVKWPVP